MALSEPEKFTMPDQLAGRGCADVHCHCLPGLDDGPRSMTEALLLCQGLVEDGIIEVIATPHQLGRFDGRSDAPSVRQAVAQLNHALRQRDIVLTVLPGADVRLDERILRLLEVDNVLTAGDGGRYLLLELPHETFIDPRILLAELAGTGIIAVITHPERDAFLSRDPTYVNCWSEYGTCLQLTAGSLVGDFGRNCERAAWELLGADLPLVVATDAHDLNSRAPRMTQAYQSLNDRLGRSAAELLCVENPKRLIAGLELNKLGTPSREMTR